MVLKTSMSWSHIFTSDLTLAITRRRGLNLNFLGIIKGDMEKVKHEDKKCKQQQITKLKAQTYMLHTTQYIPHASKQTNQIE